MNLCTYVLCKLAIITANCLTNRLEVLKVCPKSLINPQVSVCTLFIPYSTLLIILLISSGDFPGSYFSIIFSRLFLCYVFVVHYYNYLLKELTLLTLFLLSELYSF